MRRRDFIAGIAGLAGAWPLAARAQSAGSPVVGSLNSVSPAQWAKYMIGFRKGLGQMGFVEGQNVKIEYRWAEGRYDRLPSLAADLVGHQVTVIFASGGTAVARAAKAATRDIPIVFTVGGDPVSDGLVASMSRPGGNATGVTHLSVTLAAKRVEFLSELVPNARKLALISNPNGAVDQSDSKEVQAAAARRGQSVRLLWVGQDDDIEGAFNQIENGRPEVLMISPDPFFNRHRAKIIKRVADLSIPTMYSWREFVERGGLMSYGASLSDQYRLAGIYVGRLLKGDKPADLPVQQPVRFELVINLKTAKTLGLVVPPTVLVAADDVIE